MSEPGKLFIAGMRVVPKKTVSKAMRRLASVHSKMAVRRFAARYGLAMEEAERPLEDYETVLDLFTRKLKPGLRPLDPDPDALISPVDGAYLVGDRVGEGRLFQAKGRDFTLGALLADESAESRFKDGAYFIVYLSPRDYHRIHAPTAGRITKSTYVPGRLFPVNPAAVAHVSDLFSKNERLITHLATERFGEVAVVKVGATCVGHITVSYDDALVTNAAKVDGVAEKIYEPPIAVERGGELGMFQFGSTVIVVVERPLDIDPIAQGSPVRLGMRLGKLASTGSAVV